MQGPDCSFPGPFLQVVLAVRNLERCGTNSLWDEEYPCLLLIMKAGDSLDSLFLSRDANIVCVQYLSASSASSPREKMGKRTQAYAACCTASNKVLCL